jgi:hypothetical protein
MQRLQAVRRISAPRPVCWLAARIPVPSWMLVLLAVDVVHNALIARVLINVPAHQRAVTPLFRAMERAASVNVWAYALGVWSALIIVGALLSRPRIAAIGCLMVFIWWANVGALILTQTTVVSYFTPTLILLPLTIPLICQTQLWNASVRQ